MPSADSCAAIRSLAVPSVPDLETAQASPGKLGRLPRHTCRIYKLGLDGYGLRDPLPARPTKPASYPVSVRQVAVLLHASFRHHLAGMPLRFANPSPPSGWIEDFHFPATEHAGHTTRSRETRAISDRGYKMVRTRLNIGCRYSTPVRERPLHPTRGHFTPEPSQTQAPVTPATEPERRAGGSLTTVQVAGALSLE